MASVKVSAGVRLVRTLSPRLLPPPSSLRLFIISRSFNGKNRETHLIIRILCYKIIDGYGVIVFVDLKQVQAYF